MGLGLRLQKEGFNVGYMKPVGAMPMEIDVKLGDEDAAFVQDVLGLEEDPEQVTPVVVTQDFKVKAFTGKVDGLLDKIVDGYKAISESKDVTLIAGSGSMYSGKYCDTDAVSVIKKLGVKTVIIDRFQKELKYDYLMMMKEHLGDLLAGVVLNDVPPHFMEEVKQLLGPALESKGVKILGVIPHDPLMGAIKVGDLADRLGGKIISAHNKSERVVESFLIGTMQV